MLRLPTRPDLPGADVAGLPLEGWFLAPTGAGLATVHASAACPLATRATGSVLPLAASSMTDTSVGVGVAGCPACPGTVPAVSAVARLLASLTAFAGQVAAVEAELDEVLREAAGDPDSFDLGASPGAVAASLRVTHDPDWAFVGRSHLSCFDYPTGRNVLDVDLSHLGDDHDPVGTTTVGTWRDAVSASVTAWSTARLAAPESVLRLGSAADGSRLVAVNAVFLLERGLPLGLLASDPVAVHGEVDAAVAVFPIGDQAAALLFPGVPAAGSTVVEDHSGSAWGRSWAGLLPADAAPVDDVPVWRIVLEALTASAFARSDLPALLDAAVAAAH